MKNSLFHIFNLLLDPNCTIGLRQNMSCNYVSNTVIDFQEALGHCNELEMYSKKDQGIPLTNINWNELTQESLVWIGHQVSEGNVVPENQYSPIKITEDEQNYNKF